MGFGGFMKKMFPYLSQAAVLGGPVGVMAAQAIGAATGMEVKPESMEDVVNKAFADPETRLKLQRAENDFRLEMEKMGIDSAVRLEEIAAADRASARGRE